ncbi:adrenocorticotropic hormone receptor-like [Littorina saxatilis]|uniref:G-protein coupled receptors family 1 profile domain-containing protein n=1 Tax=Littorina saxatilis TaxID=31220 RepID=A0AAN9BK63_9CAEN
MNESLLQSNASNSARVSANCTRDPDSKLVNLDPVFMTFYFGSFVLVTAVNLTGNVLVLRTIYRHRSLWLPCNAFVCSLAVSDLLFGIMFPIYNVAGINTPGVNEALGRWAVCRFVLMEVLALEICSAYSLVAITAGRYIHTAFPLRYHHYVTARRCLAAVIILWLTSHISCIIVYASTNPQAVLTGQYCRICRYETVFTVRELGVLTVVQFVLPFSFMLAFYVRMACIARRLNKRVAAESLRSSDTSNEPSRGLLIQRRHKSLVIITLLIGCFVVSYLPMIAYFFLILLKGQTRTQYEYFSASSRIFLFLNTAVNVFIYAGRMSEFRDCLRRDVSPFLQSIRYPCTVTSLAASLCQCVTKSKMTSPSHPPHAGKLESKMSSISAEV